MVLAAGWVLGLGIRVLGVLETGKNELVWLCGRTRGRTSDKKN